MDVNSKKSTLMADSGNVDDDNAGDSNGYNNDAQ